MLFLLGNVCFSLDLKLLACSVTLLSNGFKKHGDFEDLCFFFFFDVMEEMTLFSAYYIPSRSWNS